MRKSAVLIVILALACLGCQAHSAHQSDSAEAYAPAASPTTLVINVSEGGQRTVKELHRGFATMCQVNGLDFPPSYLVSDLGKPDVPKITKSQMREVGLILHYVHSPTLRFQTVAGHFLVYDASLGPCMQYAPGYWVLNAGTCNVYFMPADERDGPSAVPDCFTPPRPWVPGDGGDSRIPWDRFSPSGISTPHR